MALEGSLHDLSLIDLIALFRIGVKTGVLWLIGGAEQGAVYVRAGILIDAVLLRGPARQVIATADAALIHLLQWQDAQFTFQPDSEVARHPTRMVHDHEWLIVEASRQRQHTVQASHEPAITLDTCFVLSTSPGGNGALMLDIAQWRILNQVSISPSARAICARSDVESDQAIAGLARLLALGLVEVV